MILVAALFSLAGGLDGQTPAERRDVATWSPDESVAAAVVAVGTLACMTFDEPVGEWAREHRSSATRVWAAGSKVAGDGYVTVPLAGALWWLGAQDRDPRLSRASRYALEGWLLAGVASQLVKYSVHRERPSRSSSSQVWNGLGWTDQDLSFPSGHAASAWGMLSGYALEYSDRPWIAGALLTLAASTSLSRVHDGEHWLSDVVLGAGMGYISARIVRNRRRAGPVSLVPELSACRTAVTAMYMF